MFYPWRKVMNILTRNLDFLKLCEKKKKSANNNIANSIASGTGKAYSFY